MVKRTDVLEEFRGKLTFQVMVRLCNFLSLGTLLFVSAKHS